MTICAGKARHGDAAVRISLDLRWYGCFSKSGTPQVIPYYNIYSNKYKLTIFGGVNISRNPHIVVSRAWSKPHLPAGFEWSTVDIKGCPNQGTAVTFLQLFQQIILEDLMIWAGWVSWKELILVPKSVGRILGDKGTAGVGKPAVRCIFGQGLKGGSPSH